MKKLLIMICVVVTSCTTAQREEHEHGTATSHDEHTFVTVPLNGAEKWKADEATRKNAEALMQVVNDYSNAEADKRIQLVADLQGKIDTLVKECTMKGPEHDALHVWLEQVLKDVKALKNEETEYAEAYSSLKRDVASFHRAFE